MACFHPKFASKLVIHTCSSISNSSKSLKLPFKPLCCFRSFASQVLKSQEKKWLSTVGLEVHAQISSKSKLFSASGTTFGSPVNTQVSFFDAAIPGTLPVLNRRCVEAGVLTSLALNCHLNRVSEFDRKHYFYADMPAGYQITQHRKPIASDGYLNFIVFNPALNTAAYEMKARITQVQLEQDSGKSLHDEALARSLIDLNRAGTGLMEIVFEPDLTTGEEAAALIWELCLILKRLGTCDCKMEEGSLRVDANVSVRRPNEPLGTRSEVKNINSLRAVSNAIEYEIERQIEVLEAGGQVVNETRSYDANLKRTLSMRDKEEKQDYRYMPEPNLLRLRLMDEMIDSARKSLPDLPKTQREQLKSAFGLNLETCYILVNEDTWTNYYLKVMQNSKRSPKLVANLFLTDFLGKLNKKEVSISNCGISAEIFGQSVDLLESRVISQATWQQIVDLLLAGDSRTPLDIVEAFNWKLIDNEQELVQIIQEVLDKNPTAVEAYRNGKTKTFNAFLGQIRKTSNNRVNMALATQLLKQKLHSP